MRLLRSIGVSFIEAETLGPALMAYTMLAKHFSLEQRFRHATPIYVMACCMTCRSAAAGRPSFAIKSFDQRLSLGRKFDFDENHARNVAELTTQFVSSIGRRASSGQSL